ncbi:Mu transposase domain-containing protein [Neisseria weixii]|uniref:Mu transposase domain-containing protein n=1 Tax=Neisseria weixii TaxID=1853276 RepID=UPI0039F5DEA4
MQEQESCLKERIRPPYAYCRIVQTAVNSYCLVNFEGNRYSAPCHLVRRQISLHIYLDKVQIVDGQEVVAEYVRLSGKGQTAYQPQHYLPLLKRKPGALRNGEPFKQWILPPAIKELQKHLMKQNREIKLW